VTAEIAVMNHQAVALAADSAVTITGKAGVKIFASANKIFALSKYEPMGVMIYGNASLNAMPWESIIKQYREELGPQHFAHVSDQAEHLMAWLGTSVMFDAGMKQSYVTASAIAWLEAMRNSVSEIVTGIIETEGEATRAQVRKAIRDTLRSARGFIEESPVRPHADDFGERLEAEHGDEIADLIGSVFENLPLTKTQRRTIKEIALAPLLRTITAGGSGVVVAGFGREDWMPSLREFHVAGIALDQAIYEPGRIADIGPEGGSAAYVSGFAQSDMISTFMEGVAPAYQRFIDSYLSTVIDRFAGVLADASADAALQERLGAAKDEMLSEFADELAQERYAAYIDPVLDVVRSLPKDELAGLAESLVNLTSLKRRISRDDETVGGPVDVAVISKGDGLIWIRRKHYFDPDLNPQFFANYYRRQGDGN
jgi:hypothetical protein